MKLIQASNQNKTIYVDDEDFTWLSKYAWTVCHSNVIYKTVEYASAHIAGRKEFMHRVLAIKYDIGIDDNLIVHHKDNNGLNNQKSNIEAVTRSYNNMIGRWYDGENVAWNNKQRDWTAKVGLNRSTIYIMRSRNKQKALEARQAFMAKHNLPESIKTMEGLREVCSKLGIPL